MQMRQRDVAALDAKYKELADAVLKMMLCVMMLPLVVSLISKQSVSQCVSHHCPACIMQPPPDWQTLLMGLFHLRERLITMQKQLEGTQKYINEQCR